MFAHLIALYGERMKTFRYGFLPFFGILGLICVLVIAEKHVSATIIICLIAFIMMFVGGTKFRYFAVIGGAAAAAIGALVLFSSKFAYAMDRVHGWLDPFNPPEGVDTWQTVQSLYAIGSGQLLGANFFSHSSKFGCQLSVTLVCENGWRRDKRNSPPPVPISKMTDCGFKKSSTFCL